MNDSTDVPNTFLQDLKVDVYQDRYNHIQGDWNESDMPLQLSAQASSTSKQAARERVHVSSIL